MDGNRVKALSVKFVRICAGMNDCRLIGTWRSDARKTAVEVVARRDIPASKKKKLLSLFGKLELRYTRTHCHSIMSGQVAMNPYAVVARDASSVVVIASNSIAGKQIVHIHFERTHCWVYLGSSGIREFFRRANPKRKVRTKKKN
jgi:hypothetical protein